MTEYRVQSTEFPTESTAEALLEGILEGTTVGLDELEMEGTNIRESIFEIVEVPEDE